MPATQKATKPFRGKMKKVIRDEAKLLRLVAGQLITEAPVTVDGVKLCKSPGHCAMGALMYAAGISNKRIKKFENGEESVGNYAQGPVARKLFDVYHMDATDSSEIIWGNDSVGDWWIDVETYVGAVKDRLRRVLQSIDGLSSTRVRTRPSAKPET